MADIKAFLKYKNGILVERGGIPDSSNPADVVPTMSVLGSAEQGISMFVAPGVITGTIYFESVKSSTPPPEKEIVVRYAITPAEAVSAIEKAISLFGTFRRIQ